MSSVLVVKARIMVPLIAYWALEPFFTILTLKTLSTIFQNIKRFWNIEVAKRFNPILTSVPLGEIRFAICADFVELQALKTFFGDNSDCLVNLKDLHVSDVWCI